MGSTALLRIIPLLLAGACAHVTVRRAPREVPSRLETRVDSFAISVGGRVIGSMVLALADSDGGWRLAERTVLGGRLVQQTLSTFARDGAVKFVSQETRTPAGLDSIRIAYSGGRVSGERSVAAASGRIRTAIAQDVGVGAWDDNSMSTLISTRWPLTSPYKQEVFAAGKSRSTILTLVAVGDEEIVVPAGRFHARKIDVSGGAQAVTIWLSVNAPHRVLRIATRESPMLIDLAK